MKGLLKRIEKYFEETEPKEFLVQIAPYFFLLVEIITIINPMLWSRHLEKRQMIDVLYMVWIIYAGFKWWNWKWVSMFIAWLFVPDILIQAHGSRYLVSSESILRLDAAVCSGFIYYYIWRNEAIKCLNPLYNLAFIINTKSKTMAIPLFLLSEAIIHSTFVDLRQYWERLGGNSCDFFIYQGVKIINSLEIKSVWISVTQYSGLKFQFGGENSYIIIEVTSPIKAQLAENVLNGKIPVESIMP